MIQRLLEVRWQWGSERKIDSLATQVAETSVEGVRPRIVGCMAAMTTSEARGFVRARAAQEIRRQTRILLARQQKTGTDWEARVVRRATEKVILFVLRPRHDVSSITSSVRVAA